MNRQNNNVPWDKTYFIVAPLIFVLVVVLSFLIQKYSKSFIPIIFLVPGSVWLTWGCWITYLSISSRNWLVTQGTIVKNTIGEIERPGRLGRTVYSIPVIGYRYLVDGIEYVSGRIVLFPSDLKYPTRREETEHFCAKFPLNSAVEVYYNPRSPQDAIIVVGLLSRSKQHAVIFIIIGIFFLWLGMFMFQIAA